MSRKEEYKQQNLDYLAQVASQPGVKSLQGGVLYRVINQGNGNSPSSTSVVSVYYKGSLINGRVFDDNMSFVFKPNDTYSAFEEEAPLPPPGVDAGTETQAPEENEDLPEDEDSLPF